MSDQPAACLCPEAGPDGQRPDHIICWVPGQNPNPDCSCCRKTRREIMRLRRQPATVQDMPPREERERCPDCGFAADHYPDDEACRMLQLERTHKHGES